MKRLAIYGKGGSGKSTVASNLSVQLARRGLRTLQVGCDPKHDSTRSLASGRRVGTVLEALERLGGERGVEVPTEAFLHEGILGIGCIEAGGPESGVGCAGLGIVTAFKLMQRQKILERHDVVVMDVLGDVVCGGFAMPLMRGLAGGVTVVLSDAPLSLYAANNIARAIRRYGRNGAWLAGLVANGLRDAAGETVVSRFAERLGSRVLVSLPHDERFLAAERRGMPVSVLEEGGELDAAFARLAGLLLKADPADCGAPTPMTDPDLDRFLATAGG
jgi:nitrogenase iron protein NifH